MSATPRDRTIDAVRVFAIVGVVAGHWLVTGLVPGPEGVTTASPLTSMPWAAPATWLLQTLGLLFFAGGYSAVCAAESARAAGSLADREGEPAHAREAIPRPTPGSAASYPDGPRRGPRRMPGGVVRLVLATLGLLAGWALVIFAGAALGTPTATLRTIAGLVVSPLWFLLPYLALRAGTGPLRRVVRRIGAAAVLPPIAIVAAGDVGLLPEFATLLAAWSVPWLIGMILADNDRRRALVADGLTDHTPRPSARKRIGSPHLIAHPRVASPRPSAGPRIGSPHSDADLSVGPPHPSADPWVGAALACNGAVVLACLVLIAGYPASAVGIPGAGRSNLDPPSLAAVALAVIQIGVFLLLRRPLHRILRHDRAWRPLTAVTKAAVPIYFGHQSVLLVVAGAAALVDPAMPGLLTAPDSAGWAWQRLAWLPVLCGVLALVTRARHHGEPDYLKRRLRGTLFDGSRARTTCGGDRCAR